MKSRRAQRLLDVAILVSVLGMLALQEIAARARR